MKPDDDFDGSKEHTKEAFRKLIADLNARFKAEGFGDEAFLKTTKKQTVKPNENTNFPHPVIGPGRPGV
jgi:hypothetical protein